MLDTLKDIFQDNKKLWKKVGVGSTDYGDRSKNVFWQFLLHTPFSFSLQRNELQYTAMECNVLQVATRCTKIIWISVSRMDPIFCDIFGPAERVQYMASRLIGDISTKGGQLMFLSLYQSETGWRRCVLL